MIVIDGFAFDASLRESHTLPAEVTSYPSERDGDFTDNVRLLPVTVAITGVVSDTPFLIDRPPDSVPTQDGLEKLRSVYNRRQPVPITTSLGTYDNMVLGNLKIDLDNKTGDTLPFQALFTQVERVVSELTIVTVTLPRAKGKTNLGHKASQSTDASPPAPAPSSTSKGTASLLTGLKRSIF